MGVTGRLGGRRCLVAGRGPVADAIAQRLRADGGVVSRLDGEPSSLAEEARAVEAVADVTGRLGGVDVLVTAFAEREDRPFLELDDELWERMLAENLTSAFLIGRECARAMASAGGGVIVHVGSDVGARPGPGTAAYAAAKAGVHLLATVMGLDLAPHGVRVCAVAAAEDGSETAGGAVVPGPDAVAGAVAFCASDEASYVLSSTFFVNGPLPVRS